MSIQLLVGFLKRHAVKTGGVLGMEWIHTYAVGSDVLFPFPVLTSIDFHYKNEDTSHGVKHLASLLDKNDLYRGNKSFSISCLMEKR